MNKRLLLSRLVSASFLALLLLFLWVFFNGIGSSRFFSDDQTSGLSLFKGLQPGESALRRYQREMVWVTYLDQSLRDRLIEASPYLVDAGSGCNISQRYCVVSAKTKLDSIYLQFTLQEPQKLTSGTPWFGGYVDPTNGEVYDLLGRAYQTKNTNKAVLTVIQVEQ